MARTRTLGVRDVDVTSVPLSASRRGKGGAVGVVPFPSVDDPPIMGRTPTTPEVTSDPSAFSPSEMVATPARPPKVYADLVEVEARRVVLVRVPGCRELRCCVFSNPADIGAHIPVCGPPGYDASLSTGRQAGDVPSTGEPVWLQ